MKINRIGMIAVISLSFLMIFLVTCESPNSADTNLVITITGVVTSSETGAPIVDAFVQMCPGGLYLETKVIIEARTDNGGRYNLAYTTTKSTCEVTGFWLIEGADGYNTTG